MPTIEGPDALSDQAGGAGGGSGCSAWITLEAIRQIKVGAEPLEFLLAGPALRGSSMPCWPNSINTYQPATAEVVGELACQGFRLIVAHRPEVAAEQGIP
ncbi:MAG: hypothetical protein IPN00_13735 [Hydrogenophilales bacterium]|nr:hypothetical protein [Hydrogenophilales bacterium]